MGAAKKWAQDVLKYERAGMVFGAVPGFIAGAIFIEILQFFGR